MPAYVALLRAVNVGGTGLVRMDALRDAFGRAGLQDVRTLLQSGNVVFRTSERSPGTLEHQLEAATEKDLGLRTEFFVRSADEWGTIVARNPFPREAAQSPSGLLVVALRDAPSADQWTALDRAIRGPERARGDGRTAYIVYPDGIGRSRVTPALVEKTLATRGTGRNWNTVTKLLALVASG